MTDERDLWTVVEPSIEEFEAAEEMPPPVGAKVVLTRFLRAGGTLLVIVALLFYLVVPFNRVVTRALHRIEIPGVKLRPIPLAPEPQAIPKRPV